MFTRGFGNCTLGKLPSGVGMATFVQHLQSLQQIRSGRDQLGVSDGLIVCFVVWATANRYFAKSDLAVLTRGAD